MAKTPKQPPLSDWNVVLGDGNYSESRTIRASSAIVVEGWLYLRDTYGGLLFGAPHTRVQHFRKLEPGEAAEHVPVKAVEAPEPSADPGPITAGPVESGPAQVNEQITPLGAPAPRPRSGRRTK